MGLFRRLWHVLAGKGEQKVREVEWHNPETVYDRALERKKKQAGQFLEAVAAYGAAIANRQDHLRRNLERLGKVELQLRVAINKKDREKGPKLLQFKESLQGMVDTEASHLERDQQQLFGLREKLHKAKFDLENFETQRHCEVAQINALQARNAAQELYSNIFAQDEDPALVAVRKRLATEYQQTILVDELNGVFTGPESPAGLEAYQAAFDSLCDGARNALPPANVEPSASNLPRTLLLEKKSRNGNSSYGNLSAS